MTLHPSQERKLQIIVFILKNTILELNNNQSNGQVNENHVLVLIQTYVLRNWKSSFVCLPKNKIK